MSGAKYRSTRRAGSIVSVVADEAECTAETGVPDAGRVRRVRDERGEVRVAAVEECSAGGFVVMADLVAFDFAIEIAEQTRVAIADEPFDGNAQPI